MLEALPLSRVQFEPFAELLLCTLLPDLNLRNSAKLHQRVMLSTTVTAGLSLCNVSIVQQAQSGLRQLQAELGAEVSAIPRNLEAAVLPSVLHTGSSSRPSDPKTKRAGRFPSASRTYKSLPAIRATVLPSGDSAACVVFPERL